MNSISDDMIGYSINEKAGFIQSLRNGRSPMGRPCPKFIDNSIRYIPNDTAIEIIDLVSMETDLAGKHIGIPYALEIAAEMHKRGICVPTGAVSGWNGYVDRMNQLFQRVTIFTDHKCEHTEKLSKLLGYHYSTMDMIDEPFDIIMGSINNNDMYGKLYDMLANDGIMAVIMPDYDRNDALHVDHDGKYCIVMKE